MVLWRRKVLGCFIYLKAFPRTLHCPLQFAVRASGVLQVNPADVKSGKGVQLLLSATGSARVTVNGAEVTQLRITGGALLC